MRTLFRRKWLWIAFAAAIPPLAAVLALTLVEMKINDPGPSAEEAFQRYIKNPIPKSVTDLRIRYFPHMRGYSMYLFFRIDPSDLDSVFDLRQFSPATPYGETDGVTDVPRWSEQFRKFDPNDFVNMMTRGSVYSEGDFGEASQWSCNIVVSGDHRKVYWYRFRD
jgi:hypothetical protein